jgi:hypothetical protein
LISSAKGALVLEAGGESGKFIRLINCKNIVINTFRT